MARETLLRIQRIFEADEKLKGLEHDVRKRVRESACAQESRASSSGPVPSDQKVKGAALLGARVLHQPGERAQPLSMTAARAAKRSLPC